VGRPQPPLKANMTEVVQPLARPVTVVIPTLGGESLRRTVEQLNRGVARPAEILICIPKDEAFRLTDVRVSNLRVITTPHRGQVRQRAIGFGQASQPFVLQLDDDMELDDHTVDRLLRALQSLGPGNAVGPVYLDVATGRCIHRQQGGLKGLLQSLNATVLAGAPWGVKRMGRISPAGTNFGVDRHLCRDELFETDWLPGGCVLHYRHELVTEDYYPFQGKAYSEDLMHSHLLKERGTRLWVVRDAECRTTEPVIPRDNESLTMDIRARVYYNRMRNASRWGSWRFWPWIAMSVLRRKAGIWT
jgi:hypothetical protein